MSGRKRATVSLNEEDRKRLQAASSRLSQVELDYQELRKRIQAYNHQDLETSYQTLVERQQILNESMGGINAHLQDIEQQTSQALIEQAIYFHTQNAERGDEVLSQANDLLNEHTARIYSALEETQAARQAEFLRMGQYLSRQKNQAQAKRRIARSVIDSAVGMFDAINAAYGNEPKAVKQLHDFHLALDTAAANLESDFSEAALLGAQQTYHGLSNLRVEMEVHIQQRSYLFTMVSGKTQALKEEIMKTRRVQAMDLDGNLLPVEIDTDFWTGGRLSDLENMVEHVVSRLNEPLETLEIEELTAFSQVTDQLEADLAQLVFEGRLNAISSQVRYNIAECVVNALKEQGFNLEGSAYQSDDMRNAYEMMLMDFQGNEVSIEIAPIPGEVIDHNLEMVSLDKELRTEHELRQRGRELASTLRTFGLQVGRVSGVPVELPAEPPTAKPSQPAVKEHRSQSSRPKH